MVAFEMCVPPPLRLISAEPLDIEAKKALLLKQRPEPLYIPPLGHSHRVYIYYVMESPWAQLAAAK
jgi:hypothetical protein